jgi:hypothetical protein
VRLRLPTLLPRRGTPQLTRMPPNDVVPDVLTFLLQPVDHGPMVSDMRIAEHVFTKAL